MSSGQIHFEKARAEHLRSIIELMADDELGSRREDTSLPTNPAYLKAFEAISADSNQLLAVVLMDKAVIGTLQLSFIPGLARLGAWRGQIEAVRIARASQFGLWRGNV